MRNLSPKNDEADVPGSAPEALGKGSTAMTYVFHVLVEPTHGSWKVRCPALDSHGARSGGDTKEEALVHIHDILLTILLDIEAKGENIPEDEINPKSIPISVDTSAE